MLDKIVLYRLKMGLFVKLLLIYRTNLSVYLICPYICLNQNQIHMKAIKLNAGLILATATVLTMIIVTLVNGVPNS